MDLHKLLKPYEYSKKLYRAEAAEVLFEFLTRYGEAHSWFHCYAVLVEDSDSEHYFHHAVIYWTEGQRPTLNTFNFIKDATHEVELKVEHKGYEDTWDWIMGEPSND